MLDDIKTSLDRILFVAAWLGCVSISVGFYVLIFGWLLP